MSSPAELQYSQADFLSRWMPSSTRAGVILNPSPDLAGSLRHISAVGPPPLQPDDSFASDFAPLPTSADSSCLDVDGAERAGRDRAVNLLSSAPNTHSNGGCETLDGMATKSQDLSVMMKLEQLRQWQHHMQEQLKAHQLEELLRLQEEQQRLLGVVNGSQRCKGEDSGMSGAEWGEKGPHGFSPCRESPYNPSSSDNEIPQGSTVGLQQFPSVFRRKQLSKVQGQEEANDTNEITWNSGDDHEQIVETNHLTERDYMLTQYKDVTRTEDNRRKEENLHDRPIKPGIGGQKQTFEELLEEQLRLEEQRLQSVQQQRQNPVGAEAVQSPIKRVFLKRGDGLARFTNTHSGSRKTDLKKDLKPQARIISRSYSEPTSIQKVSANRLPFQRKTAILNKENRQKGLSVATQDFRAGTKAAQTKVLGSHQRQNTEGHDGLQTDSEGRQTIQTSSAQPTRTLDHDTQPNPVTKHVGLLGVSGKAGNDAVKERNCKLKVVEEKPDSEGEVSASKDAFEVSFQKKLQCWERNRQLESVELGEFELLEQAAEELSFSSNSSFVTKILQIDKQRPHLWTATGLQRRRLSSTPIKSPPRGAVQRCSSVGNSGGLACGGSSVSSEVFIAQMRGDALKRKECSDDGEEQNNEKEDKPEISDISSCDGSEFGDKKAAAQSAICFPAASNSPYDKRSYEDEDSFEDFASDATQEDSGESDDVLSNVDDSTLIEKRGQQDRVVFDDDDTWNDLEDTAIGSASNSREESPVSKPTSRRVSPSDKIVLRKVAGGKVREPKKHADVVSVSLEPDPPPSPPPCPPPASQLMTRLFPSLKPKPQNAPLPPPPAAVVSVAKNPSEESGQQVQSRQLRERLVELEIEIERFKKENAALAKVRQENEKTQESLRKERLEFQQTKAEEMAQFEEYKKEENKKLQKERKLFEKHAAAARAIPDKKEREEIQGLKQQLSSLQEELSRRESRWTSTHSRLRQQMDSLNQENSSLRDEIRMLEKLRLSAWQKAPVHSEDTETTHGRRSSDSNGPSVIKGVTFASPVASRGNSSSPPQSSATSRRASRDVPAATGIKSSLRKLAGPGSSSSSLPSKRTEETSPPVSKSQEKPPHQPKSSGSVKRDSVTKGPQCSEAKDPEPAKEVLTHPDGKVEKVLVGGDRLIVFPNGTKKEISADGQSVKVTFFNGDTKQITADQRVIYYYSEAQTTHITDPDGMEVLHFPNNQTEKHFPDGRKEITFPDQTVKNLFPDGREESVLTDGTIIQVNPDGTKEIHFNTGQKEIHTADYKRREYPDGTVKTVYTDGRQETRYPTGRVRIKDKEGNVVLDNME